VSAPKSVVCELAQLHGRWCSFVSTRGPVPHAACSLDDALKYIHAHVPRIRMRWVYADGSSCHGYLGRSLGPAPIWLVLHNASAFDVAIDRRSRGGAPLCGKGLIQIRHSAAGVLIWTTGETVCTS
jgi:hypothetical protein